MPKQNQENYEAAMIGNDLNFAAREAYRMLRTNLEFCLPGKKRCRVIGVTSSVPQEGKSTTTVNLAYTFAQTGQTVLLLEADLRLPTLAKRMKISPKPGLSNLLAGQCKGSDILQRAKDCDGLWLVTAGDIPPNPSEMLGSSRMEITLQTLGENFDIILIDLPPVNVVTDAVLISKYLDGIVVVTRREFCEKKALDETIRQLKFANAKILGLVQTHAAQQVKGSSYRKNGYYGYGDANKSPKGPKAGQEV